MERITRTCTCDDHCDDPCPMHARENDLQNEVIKLREAYDACSRERQVVHEDLGKAKKELKRLREKLTCNCCGEEKEVCYCSSCDNDE